MSTRRSDAVSAALVALAVWIIGRIDGRTPRELLRPRSFLTGVVAAIAIEVGFALWPERADRLWRRPAVRFGSPVALVGAVLLAGRHARGTVVAATLGGLAGYFSLLAGIVVGVVPDPATWFGAERSDPRGTEPSDAEPRDAVSGGDDTSASVDAADRSGT